LLGDSDLENKETLSLQEYSQTTLLQGAREIEDLKCTQQALFFS